MTSKLAGSGSRSGPISVERLRELLDYDPETGVFRWKVARHPGNGTRNEPGSVAGTVKDRNRDRYRYLLIWVDGKLYRAHRLAWFYVHGVWPRRGIDHIDGNAQNNAIANLRECTQQQNNGNHAVLNRHNTSGYRGVSWSRGKWRAYININNKQKNLGRYETKEAAYAAYCVAARDHFGEFARLDVTNA